MKIGLPKGRGALDGERIMQSRIVFHVDLLTKSSRYILSQGSTASRYGVNLSHEFL